MKTTICAALSLAGVLTTQAQSQSSAAISQQNAPAPTAFHIVASGPNTRIWQHESFDVGPNGEIGTRIHRVTELASGLNVFENNQWVEANDQIEAFSGGAVARHGQTQIIFANNLNSEGAIDMQTLDGKRLRSNIIGLVYWDRTTGQGVWVALVQDSTGQLISDNEVLYTNAFDGVDASVRYSNHRGGMEQDVIINAQPPAPELFGLNSQNVDLEVVTEFIDPPATTVQAISSGEQTSGGLEADEGISWGATSLGRGRAFDLDGSSSVPVSKQYVTIQGRKFLIEKVRLKTIKPYLSDLPGQTSIQTHQHTLLALADLLQRKSPSASKAVKPIKTAKYSPLTKGFVLDYVTLSASYTNYTFRADTVYYLSGSLNLCGTSTFEGGTVIKFAAGASITEAATPFTPKVVFSSGAYRPVVFTAKDDNAIGEPVSGSTGNPVGYYANPALNLPSGGAQSLSNFRISYANVGLSAPGTSLTVSDAQIINSGYALSASGAASFLRNVLLVNNKTNFSLGSGVTLDVQNATFSKSLNLVEVPAGATTNSTLLLTNCVFANITNVTAPNYALSAGWNGFYNTTPFGAATTTSTGSPFKVAGAASYYLTNGGSFVDAGTANIDPVLLADLATKTTCPPMIYSNTALPGGIYSPVAQRDTNTPDFGYHYDPLDYCFGRANAVTNIVFTAGTAVGCFDLHATSGEPYNSYGLGLGNALSVTYQGTLAAPCAQVRYSTVQEGNGNWTAVGNNTFEGVNGCVAGIGSASYNPAIAATINARFTLFTSHAWQPGVGNDYSSDLICRFTDCTLNAGRASSYNVNLCFTNCLLLGTYLDSICSGNVSAAIYLQNCTMREGWFGATRNGGATWPIKIQNTAFESVDFSNLAGESDMTNTNLTYCDYNAWITNQNRFPLIGSHDVTVTNFNWQTSWLGNFYLPSNSPLINAGNTNADQWGLYHFTTQTNQVKETNSIVDIGYHFVATDAFGNPIDTNGDGVPDYLEDVNGNGVFDGLELVDWQLPIYRSGVLTFTNGLNLNIFEPKPRSYIP